MTNRKNTKRALVLSLLSLLLCCSMLVGTTFAWFTDSVTSAKNTIVAGNLDVELEYYTDGKWERVNADTNVFATGTLWEPGHTEVVYLRVLNVGTLALEYSLGVKIASEIPGTNVAGKTFKLSDYIEFDAVENKQNPPYASREEARQAVAEDTKTQPTRLGKGTFHKGGDLYPVGNPDGKISEEYVCLVVYMPEEIGNEANYRGDAIPTIELGINMTATQKTYEADSFGIDYDGASAGNSDLPVAKVTQEQPKAIKATLGMGGAAVDMTTETTFVFETTETKEEAEKNPYRFWHADFVVTANKDIPANSIALVGYYEAYCDDYNDGNWVALTNDFIDGAIKAGQQVRLLELMLEGGPINYQELCEWIPKFECGALRHNVAGMEAGTIEAGTTLTVQLRIYETDADPDSAAGSKNDETGVYEIIGTYEYTFQ